MYTLETHHYYTRNGIEVRETKLEEYDDLTSAQKAIMLYKLSERIGYTLYNTDMVNVPNDKTQHANIVEQWFDKNAYRGGKNAG